MSMMKTVRRIGLVAALGCAALLSAQTASASSYTLDQSNCCGSGPFGTVVVTQVSPNLVDVLVTLNPNIGFINSGSGTNHPGFSWNLIGAPSLTGLVTIIQDGGHDWTLLDTPGDPQDMSDNLGTYEFAENCDCGPGGSDPDFGPLEFQIALAGITPASFVANSDGTIFAADIIDKNLAGGPTGLVWTTEENTTVPEPASLWLLGMGLAGIATKRRKTA